MISPYNPFYPWIKLLSPYALVFLLIQIATRAFLLVYSGQSTDITFPQALGVFGWGFLFDIEVLGFFLLPLIVFHSLQSKTKWQKKSFFYIRLVFFATYTYLWLFTAVSEYFFWEEFGTRFNFIAVDYLIYTTEVIGNIVESYPLYPLLFAIGVITILLTCICKKSILLKDSFLYEGSFQAISPLVLLAVPLILFSIINTDQITLSPSQAIQEAAQNGTYNLFSAYRNNELSYKDFYKLIDEKEAGARLRELLSKPNQKFADSDYKNITRLVGHKGPELRKNVVLVVMESMSADFMKAFGNGENLTPQMDALSKKGLFLTNLYATGTRTVRGLEALTLSVPPTPGQSILRRPGNKDLYSLGYVFQDRGYDTAFIYGGHGYFDNMNEFFGGNGFRILDRHDFPDGDITFSNVWGVADEDLYNQVIKQADQAHNNKQPFMYEVMTTSNHRPYTFPENRIDLPSKTGGRSAGVKYADYAVGKFLKDAESKPWFKNTIFIFVADHTAGAGGKTELSPQKYHIPAIFYSPEFIKPQEYGEVASQIDIAPTLLGLLNFTYYSKFFGYDLLDKYKSINSARAFISNYQKLGYMKDGQLTVLEPNEKVSFYAGEQVLSPDRANKFLLNDTISYYQYSSDWRVKMKRIPTKAN